MLSISRESQLGSYIFCFKSDPGQGDDFVAMALQRQATPSGRFSPARFRVRQYGAFRDFARFRVTESGAGDVEKIS